MGLRNDKGKGSRLKEMKGKRIKKERDGNKTGREDKGNGY